MKDRTAETVIPCDLTPKNEVPIGKVYSFDEFANDPHIQARQMTLELTHPTKGKIKQAGITIMLSDTLGQIKTLGSQLREHIEEVLLELGYSNTQIKQLERTGAILLMHKD